MIVHSKLVVATLCTIGGVLGFTGVGHAQVICEVDNRASAPIDGDDLWVCRDQFSSIYGTIELKDCDGPNGCYAEVHTNTLQLECPGAYECRAIIDYVGVGPVPMGERDGTYVGLPQNIWEVCECVP